MTKSGHRGPVRIDAANRWHFIWEGTGEHYFFNGTTAYWLIGWKDDLVIQSSIERLHRLKINRIRMTIAGRTGRFFGEPVVPGPNWTPFITAWPAGRALPVRLRHRLGIGLGNGFSPFLGDMGTAADIYHPGFDYTRFDVPYWQKFEHALRFARDRDVIFSLVLDMNDSQVHPTAGGADERRFIRYALGRFGAFSNITWDLGDDLDHYRDDRWTHDTGTSLKHRIRTGIWRRAIRLTTCIRIGLPTGLTLRHSRNGRERSTPSWWRNAKNNRRSAASFRRPTRNTGTRTTTPLWAQGLGSESADTLRRTAWDIVMAGGYQTAGETARRGTNIWPDTGGGWMNGRGDDTMTMFVGYAHMVDFFTSFDWWKTEPHDELVNNRNYCLAKAGEIYAIYLPRGGDVTVQLQPGKYAGTWWNAVTGQRVSLPIINAAAGAWTSPAAPGTGDWALLLEPAAG